MSKNRNPSAETVVSALLTEAPAAMPACPGCGNPAPKYIMRPDSDNFGLFLVCDKCNTGAEPKWSTREPRVVRSMGQSPMGTRLMPEQ